MNLNFLPEAIQMAFWWPAADDGLPAQKKRRAPRRPRLVAPTTFVQLEFELIIPTDEEFLEMTDEDIFEFRSGLLSRALRAVIDGRVSKASRREWWEWVASNEIAPFSFLVCVLEAGEGVVNPQELREVFASFVRRHHKKFAAEIPFPAA